MTNDTLIYNFLNRHYKLGIDSILPTVVYIDKATDLKINLNKLKELCKLILSPNDEELDRAIKNWFGYNLQHSDINDELERRKKYIKKTLNIGVKGRNPYHDRRTNN